MLLKLLKQSDNHKKNLTEIFIESTNELNLINDISKQEFFQRVNLAMENLPLRQKEALKLRYIEEKKYIEIQGIMGISISGARKDVCKAIKNLRKSLMH
jgi:RNA polymerase sigma factor (sigma-70 family)